MFRDHAPSQSFPGVIHGLQAEDVFPGLLYRVQHLPAVIRTKPLSPLNLASGIFVTPIDRPTVVHTDSSVDLVLEREDRHGYVLNLDDLNGALLRTRGRRLGSGGLFLVF